MLKIETANRLLSSLVAVALVVLLRICAVGFMPEATGVNAHNVHRERITLKAADGQIGVFIGENKKPVQMLEYNQSALTELNKDYFFETPDINFDGLSDLTAIYAQGTQNIYFDGWIWDAQAQCYVFDPIIRTLASPIFDALGKEITTFEHISSTDHIAGVYRYIDGQLTEVERIEQFYDESDNRFVVRNYVQIDGSLTQVNEQRLTQEELEAPA